jgi:hypothetical protein
MFPTSINEREPIGARYSSTSVLVGTRSLFVCVCVWASGWCQDQIESSSCLTCSCQRSLKPFCFCQRKWQKNRKNRACLCLSGSHHAPLTAAVQCLHMSRVGQNHTINKLTYIRRICLYIWWYPCQEYPIYIVYRICMVPANPTYELSSPHQHQC